MQHVLFWYMILQDTKHLLMLHIEHCNNDHVTIMLAGNKVDLKDSRQVSFEEANKFAEQNNLMFMETSAKTGYNLDEMFRRSAENVYFNIGAASKYNIILVHGYIHNWYGDNLLYKRFPMELLQIVVTFLGGCIRKLAIDEMDMSSGVKIGWRKMNNETPTKTANINTENKCCVLL
eukprot:264275_1